MKPRNYTNGQKLKLIRLNLLWSQDDMARHLKIDTGLLSRYENDKRNIPDEIMASANKLIRKVPHEFGFNGA